MIPDKIADLGAIRRDGANSRLLIGSHESAVADDVSAQDRREATFDSVHGHREAVSLPCGQGASRGARMYRYL